MGVPPGSMRLQEQTLLRVVHILKSGFGTSTSYYYTSDALHRIYGVSQGSKAYPVAWWVAVSLLLFEAQDILSNGFSLQNPPSTFKEHHGLKWERIKGHQDDKKKWYGLTWMETLNVRPDYHATEGLDIPGPPTIIPWSTIPGAL
jgi:hypothetical protein